MGIGDAIMVSACLAGTMFALPAMLIFFSLAFPHSSARAANRLAHGGVIPFFVGLIPALAIGVPSAFLLSLGSVFQFCGTILYFALFTWAFAGLGVVAVMLGQRFGEATGLGGQALSQYAVGAFILTFAISFPIIGWFVILPVALICGTGALVLGVVNYRWGRLQAEPSA